MTRKELKRYLDIEVLKGGNDKSFLKRIAIKWLNSRTESAKCVRLIRKMQYYGSKQGFLNMIITKRYEKKLMHNYCCHISPYCEIGEGLHLPHPIGIVIGRHVKIGNNVSLYQHVTLGGRRTGDVLKGNQPQIGNNVTVFLHSMVLGDIHVADNTIIGANSVLLQDTQPGSVFVGSPAKRVK